MQEIRIDGQPQFFIDDYLVDNRWGVEYLTEAITRVFHVPVKHPANPVIAERGGYVNVLRADGRFRMWYQDYWDQSWTPRKYTYGVAYAESEDGLNWQLPRIGRHAFKDTTDNNIVLLGPGGNRAEVPYLLDVPEKFRRGYEYLLLYLTDEPKSARLIGSHDGISWDPASGGFVVTKILRSPGGRLFVNADATRGELRVRLTDYGREPLPGFDAPSRPISGDGMRQAVCWEGTDTPIPADRPLRLEFELQGVVDLYSFCFTTAA